MPRQEVASVVDGQGLVDVRCEETILEAVSDAWQLLQLSRHMKRVLAPAAPDDGVRAGLDCRHRTALVWSVRSG